MDEAITEAALTTVIVGVSPVFYAMKENFIPKSKEHI